MCGLKRDLKFQGYSAFIVPALQTNKGGITSGVALCWKSHFAITVHGTILWPGRLGCVVFTLTSLGECAVYSLDRFSGESLGPRNRDLLGMLRQHAEEHGKAFLVGVTST